MDDDLFPPNPDPISDQEANELMRWVGASTASVQIAKLQACILTFTERSNDRDFAGMDAMLHFPHIILSGEKMAIWDAPSRLPDDFFERLSSNSG